MSKFYGMFIISVALLLILATPAQLFSQLTGTYTIGGLSPSYATFTDAVAALRSLGVLGPVTFNVRTGSYNEQISLHPPISGLSASNTVTFQSQSGTASDVTLFYVPTAANNYVVDIDSVSYITFTKMTVTASGTGSYGVVFQVRGTANRISITNNILNGISIASSSGNYAVILVPNQHVDSLTVSNNTMNNGSYGLAFSGVSGNLSKGTVVSNNVLNPYYYGLYFQYQDAPVISGNTLNGVAYNGIEVDYSMNGVQIVKNKIISGGINYGISMYQSVGGGGFPNLPGLIANNFISNGSAGGVYGLYFTYCSNFNIYNNSVNMTGSSTNSGTLYFYGGSGNNVENNVFSNPGGGYTYNMTTASIGTIDHNDVYTSGNYLAVLNSGGVSDLAALQTATGQEANSVSYNPLYASTTDLHSASPWINNKGTPLADVTDDIDGQLRSLSTPDIGADEFTPAGGTTTPLAGTYTIGATGTYNSFNAAVADLLLKGVSAPVTFNVQTGQYGEHFVLTDIPGSSPTNVVSFQALTNNAANATLYFTAAAAESNYVVRLKGARHLRFHKMTFIANNASGAPYCRVFELAGGWSDLTIDSAVLSGAPNTSNTNQAVIGSSDASSSKICVINGSTFTNGGYGIYITGSGSYPLCKNTQITGNTFTNFYYGIYLSYHDAPLVSGNTVTNPGYYGIAVDYSANNIQILKNKVTGAFNYGITSYQSTGGAGFPNLPALVANNFIANSGTGGVYGFSYTYSSNFNFYHNSVNMTGSSTNSTGIYFYGGSGNNLENNIFSNPGGGYAYNVYTPGSISTTDYNDVYTTGNYVALWSNVGVGDLAALQVATGQEANSVSYNPIYTSATNLHSASPWINNKGTPLADVTDDIDGQARDVSTPDIGADEYTPAGGTTTPLAGAYTIGATGTYPTFNAAAAALLLRGVSAPVTFNVQTAASYNEHIVLTDIPGSSPANTITFQALTNNAANVTLYFFAAAPESNYVVRLNGGRNVRFHKMTLRSNNASAATYSRVFELVGGWSNLTIDSVVLSGAPNAGGSANQALIGSSNGGTSKSCVINGSTFSNDGFGMYITGLNASALCKNTQITNNTFTNFYTGINLSYHDSPLVSGNTVTNPSYNGISVDYSSNNIQILKNKITGSSLNYGISLYQSAGGAGFPNLPGLIANNFIANGSTGGVYGFALTYTSNINIYHNSVNMTGSSTNSTALYFYGGSGNNLENNIFSCPGGGYAYNVYTPGSVATIDYNELYTTGNYIALWSNIGINDLAALRVTTTQELNSVSYNPVYTSATNLHAASPWINNKGTALADVTEDIDGEARDGSNPDIGADEYTPAVGATPPLAGTYTIGATGTYPSFNTAVADLLLRGVSAPVTFNVQTGIYTEHIVLTDIPGTSPSSVVTFQALTNNAANVTLLFSAAAAESNYVVRLNGAHYLRFHKMTFLCNNASNAPYSRIIELMGGWHSLVVDSSFLSGAPNAGNSDNQSLIGSSTGSISRGCLISGNSFTNGGRGVYLSGINGSALCQNAVVTYNTITASNVGIDLQYNYSPIVMGNTVTEPAYAGIAVDYSANAIQIVKNKVASTSASYGISMNSSVGGTGFANPPVFIANNFVSISRAASVTGLYMYNCSNVKIYYNSVNMTGSATGSSCLNVTYGNAASVNVINNIFSNPGTGYAYYFYPTTMIDTTDHNDVYSTGTRVAYWGADQATLAALRTASGKELNSISADPAFFSVTNLRTISSSLDSAGVPLSEVIDDIDGNLRNLIKSDIGASEFSLTVNFAQSIISGWNLVSVPVTVADFRKTVLYPTATSRAYVWAAPGAYLTKDTLRNKTGYWLKFPGVQSAPLSGTHRLRDTITVTTGWNMIGGISYPMPKTAIIQTPLSNVKSPYYYYSNGYGQSDTIKPGVGYWVKVNGGGTLIFDVNQTSAAPAAEAKEAEALNLAQFNVLTFEQSLAGASASGQLFFTSTDESSTRLEQFAVPPAPPAEVFDIRFSSNRIAESFNIDGTTRREIPLLMQGSEGKVRVSWTMSEGSNVRYILVEKEGSTMRAEHPLNAGGSLVLEMNGDRSYSLRTDQLPAEYALLQNYPNPFNPTTRIQFTLAERSSVTMRIFNILGQTVATPLLNESMDKGAHSLDINAREWVSGIYFYQITAGSFTDVKKMVLLK